jgi:hypothetical protein
VLLLIELVRSVGVALQRLPPSACPAFDPATISDLVDAVVAGLSSCAGAD